MTQSMYMVGRIPGECWANREQISTVFSCLALENFLSLELNRARNIAVLRGSKGLDASWGELVLSGAS